MSRVHFNSPTAYAELAGAERGWLRHLASGTAVPAWGLYDSLAFERAQHIMSMVDEVPEGDSGANYLHRYLREAQEGCANGNYSLTGKLTSALRTLMDVSGLELRVHGVRLHTHNLGYNTALIAGSDPIALAAKISGYCDVHCWVEGPDRAWLADVIEQALRCGLYRTDMGWDGPGEFDLGPGVAPLLRARADEPVVLSFSGGNRFPHPEVGGWMPEWPQGVPLEWNALTTGQQRERSTRNAAWFELTHEQQWAIAMQAQRTNRPWARLSQETLRTEFFDVPLNVYDVMDPSRADHVREVLAGEPGFLPATQVEPEVI